MKRLARWSAFASLVLLCSELPGVARAQDYPEKPVRIVVPFTPGGSTDLTARIVAEGLAVELKQPFVIENRPGAAGTIGVDLVAKSKPDGYTIGLSGVGPTSIIPAIDKNLSYTFERDLEVIAGLTAVDGFIVARAEFPHKDIKELLDYARANPGKVTYGTAGVAGPAQLQAEDLSLRAGVNMLHVPFAGDAPAIAAILAGDVDIGFVAVAAATTFVSSGKMKALAAGGPGRLKSLPDLLTVAEQTGFKDYTAYAWNILVAPKGTARNVIEKLNKAVNEVVAKPEIKQRLENIGLRTLPGDTNSAADFVAGEIAKNKRIIEVTGIKRQ
jgi:tripartite-type tricarboxylate transporter receptor subunit TctC